MRTGNADCANREEVDHAIDVRVQTIDVAMPLQRDLPDTCQLSLCPVAIAVELIAVTIDRPLANTRA